MANGVKPFLFEANLCDWLARDIVSWASMVDISNVAAVHVEYQISLLRLIDGVSRRDVAARNRGTARIDLVVETDAGCFLVEAKNENSTHAVLGGVGQLIHYKTLFETIEKRPVVGLVLATTHLPPFIDKTLEAWRMPVSVLHVTEAHYFGFVPKFPVLR